jgi:FlaA1/EpsC-like NDP-sugar epimerase
MLRKIILRNSDRFLSHWIVLIFDLLVVSTTYQVSVILRYNLEITSVPSGLILVKLPFVLLSYLIGFTMSKSHIGVIRHTGISDAYAIFRGGLISLLILSLGSNLAYYYEPKFMQFLIVPNSVLVIQFLLGIVVLIGSRFAVKRLFFRFQTENKVKVTSVMIYGAGASGMITKNTLELDTSREYRIVCFIDDNPKKIGKSIEGVPILPNEKAFNKVYLVKNKVDQVILSIQTGISVRRKNEIVDQSLSFDIGVKVIPPVDSWIQGELSTKQIKSVRIEDLLEREEIKLDSKNVQREVNEKKVLITGAAGSIGSELVRQVMYYKPSQVILLDQAESPMYELSLELKNIFDNFDDIADCVIADVSDRTRLEKVFENYRPDLIFHAAAYKHVPLMEDNPYEAVSVNVLGTKNMADLAVKYGVSKFVMVSTDKAVNPTNVMGATKRTAELYTQSVGSREGVKTQFITTRFGNVLGSNGSVIPVFRRQLEKGGPITLTHKDITRYFMTIPEACNLVLEAGAMGKGGEIFVFDMGESVKIYDLAKKMIKLSGFELGKDMEIVEVGLRPGEKLYEELLTGEENTIETHHPKIMIAQTMEMDADSIHLAIERVRMALGSNDNLSLVASLKSLVPEYISNNSIYESLDLQVKSK